MSPMGKCQLFLMNTVLPEIGTKREKMAHRITDPPPYLTVGMMCFPTSFIHLIVNPNSFFFLVG